jgi:xanthine dehydrogenase YagS FAD-binding subunit
LVPFGYTAAPDLQTAISNVTATHGAEFIAGGTDMLQLLQEGVRTPIGLIDLNRLPIADIEVDLYGARIGALARMAEVADDPCIQEQFPIVVEALLASASPQVRNVATIGGNLLQRTRCLYFRDIATPCNKREPGSGCPAQDGENRMNAILGVSPHCIAAYPGDLAVALVALDAEVQITGIHGQRRIPIEELHRLPGDTPHIETVLERGDIITAVLIPASPFAKQSHYLKVRDRAAFEWALASAAVALETEGGEIHQARVVVGGVATKPWRLRHVEAALTGRQINADALRAAAARAADGVQPCGQNLFKVELVKHVVERAVQNIVGGRT